MRALVVFCHPEPRSFNAALKDEAVATLSRLGWQVEVSDLYAMGWDPALGPGDFDEDARADAAFLDLSREQEHAFAHGTHAADVRGEQAKVAAADLVIFQCPVWWFSLPAMLKGWIDRVFSRGFAYSAGRKYGTGHFHGKRAMLSLTTGTASTLYEPAGIDGDLLHVLWPIHNGILAYTGFTVLPPHVAWAPARATPGAARRAARGLPATSRVARDRDAAVLPSLVGLRRDPAPEAGHRRALGRAVESARRPELRAGGAAGPRGRRRVRRRLTSHP
ncbi:MAG: NAD(P)H-dependent oxidoreductase [Burkholderiaceae bacterium]